MPVHLRNQDYSDAGCVPPDEKAERNRIYRAALEAGLAAGSVCIYLLSPDARPLAVAPLNQRLATDPERLADLMEQVVRQLNVAKGQPLIAPTAPSPPECEPGSLALQLTARYLQQRGSDLVRLDNQAVLGTKSGGNWGDLPSQDWIVLTQGEAAKLLPSDTGPGAVRPGISWEPDHDVCARLLKHFFPPTENTDFVKNRIDELSIHAQVDSIQQGGARARISGKFRMKHTFYHNDDNYFVDATVIGNMEFDPASLTVRSLRLVTDHATYGDSVNRPHQFGVAVRNVVR